MLLIATAFNLSVVGITGISGDQLMQINQFLKANALAGLGNAYLCLEEHEEASASYQKSLAICEEIEHRQGAAATLGNLGIAYGSFGQYEQAIDYHEKSLAIDREIKHRQGEATSLNNIGSVYRQLQQTEKAIKNYQGGQYLVGCG